VEALRPERAPGTGEIVDEAGRTLGLHGGVHRYTVGQRRGLGLAGERPLYVKSLDAARNRVVVAPKPALAVAGARIEGVNWIAGEAPAVPLEVRVRIRYRHAGAPATVAAQTGRRAAVRFHEPVTALAPGQAAVFYDGDRVLGGGWIAGPSA